MIHSQCANDSLQASGADLEDDVYVSPCDPYTVPFSLQTERVALHIKGRKGLALFIIINPHFPLAKCCFYLWYLLI